MKINRIEGSAERNVLIGMITSTHMLARMIIKYQQGMLSSDWGNLIANWCISHYRTYHKAPRESIGQIYNEWAEGQVNETLIDAVGTFLNGLSEQHFADGDNFNVEYASDQAASLFNKNKIATLQQDISLALENRNVDEALQVIQNWKRVDLGVDAGLDIFASPEAFQRALEQKQNSCTLIRYPGAAGEFIDNAFERDSFTAFAAPAKRTKSFNLLDCVWRGVQQKHRVAYFAVGDMSQDQIMLRLMSRILKRPVKPESIFYPTSIIRQVNADIAEVETRKLNYRTFLDWKQAYEKCREFITSNAIEHTPLRLSVHPSMSVSVADIGATIENWEQNFDWVPDVVVIDYADVLAPSNLKLEYRHQINDTWARLRALSQQYHIAVITATQVKKEGRDAYVLGPNHFSEDRRKLDHVTGMIGINITEAEKELGLSRWNWIVGREVSYTETTCVFLAGALPVSNPCILSTW